jgi:hypothetical protein
MLRPANSADLNRVVDLWYERTVILSKSDRRFAAHLAGEDGGRSARIAEMAKRINNPAQAVIVAECIAGTRNADLAGYVTGCLQANNSGELYGVVDELVLDMHVYYGGLARMLWKALHEWFEQHDAICLFFSVPRYSPVEQAFWRSIGAVEWTGTLQQRPEFMWMTL